MCSVYYKYLCYRLSKLSCPVYGLPSKGVTLSIDSKEVLVFVTHTTENIFCYEGFKRGSCCEIKKKNSKASCDKSLEIFCTLLFYPFSEVICTTKALLQGK